MIVQPKPQTSYAVANALSGYWAKPGSAGRYFGFTDLHYSLPTRQELDQLLQDPALSTDIIGRPDIYDCDDYAFTLRAAAARYGYNRGLAAPLALGIAWGFFNWNKDPAGVPIEHVCNWALTADSGLYWIEPQLLRNNGATATFVTAFCAGGLQCVLV